MRPQIRYTSLSTQDEEPKKVSHNVKPADPPSSPAPAPKPESEVKRVSIAPKPEPKPEPKPTRAAPRLALPPDSAHRLANLPYNSQQVLLNAMRGRNVSSHDVNAVLRSVFN